MTDAKARLASDPSLAERPRNFLEAMLTARDENGNAFDDEAIFGNAMTMLLAGEDTTAYTLAWCVHHLLDAPEDVAALRAELDDVLGQALVPPSIDAANRLAYASGVANETMRLRPVAPIFFMEATADTVVGEVEIPAGMVAVLMIGPPAVSIANFDAPDEFRPSRWLDDRPARGPHDASAHQPFGSGPRMCPGRALALLEMKLALATIYQSFEVERVGSSSDVREELSFTMMPVGLKVKLRPRQPSKPETLGFLTPRWSDLQRPDRARPAFPLPIEVRSANGPTSCRKRQRSGYLAVTKCSRRGESQRPGAGFSK